ncbi:MAG: efflux RND transporter periplasmic adaptor subunit [bacterium]
MKQPIRLQKAIRAVTLALILAAFAIILIGCATSNANSNGAEIVAVRTAKVEKAMLAQPVRVTGVLTGKAESKLSFKIGGIIDRIHVREGQSVRQGQLLATLKLSEINAQVSQAQNAFDKAERDLKRVQNLYNDKVTTLEQLQDATTGFEIARSALEIAKFNWRYANIHAPASGKILKRFAEENELVSPGTPVLTLSSVQAGWVLKAGLPDRDVVRVALGDSARLIFDAFSQQSFTATVMEISGTASAMTGTFEVELAVAPEGMTPFMSGMIGKAEIEPSRKEPVSLIPIAALVEADGNRGNVYTLAPANSAKKQAVAVAFIHGEQAAISSGLENISVVVTDGAAYLTEGVRVKIVQ